MTMTHEEMQRRFLSVRTALSQSGLDALLICGRGGGDTGRGGIHYLTDHHLLPAGHYFLLVTTEGPVALTQVAETGRAWAERGHWVKRVVVGENQNHVIAEEIARSVGEAARVGIVGLEELIGLADLDQISEALPDISFESATALYDGIRFQKSELELKALHAANDLLCRAMVTASGVIRLGISEREIAAHCLRTIRGLGGSDTTVHIARLAGLGAFHSPNDSAVAQDDVVGVRLKARGVDYYAARQIRYFALGDVSDEVFETLSMFEAEVNELAARIAIGEEDLLQTGDISESVDRSVSVTGIGTDFVEAVSIPVTADGELGSGVFSINLTDWKNEAIELSLHATVSAIDGKANVFPGSTVISRL